MSQWVEAVFEQVKTLWGEGLSAGKIARTLGGGITRNAILGKLSREGFLKLNRPKASPHQTRAQPRARSAVATKHCAPLPDAIAPVTDAKPVPMLELLPKHCRWPLWSPEDATQHDFPHCGLPKTVGSYCAHHAVTAFGAANVKAMQARKDGPSKNAKVVQSNRGLDGGW